jgi:hypothetical protein
MRACNSNALKQSLTYSLSWKIKQIRLFICVRTLLAHHVLDNVSLLLNQMFCFTVLEIYFLLVVYSLYGELEGTAPPSHAWRVRLNNTFYERECLNSCLPVQLGWVLLIWIYISNCNCYKLIQHKAHQLCILYQDATAPSGPRPPHYRGFTITLRITHHTR